MKAVGERSGSKIGSRGSSIQDDPRAEEGFAVLVGQQQHRLGGVPDLALHQAGLIVGDQGDDVPARDVAVVHDGEAGGIEVEPDAGERPQGMVVRIVRPNSMPGKRRSSA